MKKDNICRIPVSATMQIIDGKAVMVAAEYADIPAEDIARFIVERMGVSAVPGLSDEGGDAIDA